jgi:hypothetical protein
MIFIEEVPFIRDLSKSQRVLREDSFRVYDNRVCTIVRFAIAARHSNILFGGFGCGAGRSGMILQQLQIHLDRLHTKLSRLSSTGLFRDRKHTFERKLMVGMIGEPTVLRGVKVRQTSLLTTHSRTLKKDDPTRNAPRTVSFQSPRIPRSHRR